MMMLGSDDGRVFIRGLRLDHSSSDSFKPPTSDLRSGARFSAPITTSHHSSSNISSSSSPAAAAAAAEQQQQHQQQESLLRIQDAAQPPLLPFEGPPPAAASTAAASAAAAVGAAAAGSAAGLAAAAAAADPGGPPMMGGWVEGFSFLEVLVSNEAACSLPYEGASLRFRTLLSLIALVLLAIKMLLSRDRNSRPRKLLLLDFCKTASACTLLLLLPPSEGALVAPQPTTGSDPHACETYAAVQLIQAVLWLTLLKLLLLKAENLLGCRQGGYLLCSGSSRSRSSSSSRRSRYCCCCFRTDLNESPPAAAAAGEGGGEGKAEAAADRFHLVQQKVLEVRRWLLSPPEVSWVRYGQELVALLLCVAAAQAATALLLLVLVGRLSPLLRLPLSLLLSDSANLRRLFVGFACPLFTDLLQSCSLDKLIRTQPKRPCCCCGSCQHTSDNSNNIRGSSNSSTTSCGWPPMLTEEEQAFLND
ncbi:hypothetical protein ACSSS7_005350 [Eimeria intestinalis]